MRHARCVQLPELLPRRGQYGVSHALTQIRQRGSGHLIRDQQRGVGPGDAGLTETRGPDTRLLGEEESVREVLDLLQARAEDGNTGRLVGQRAPHLREELSVALVATEREHAEA